MDEYIIFNGITTNNLKNININIEKNKITAIYGRSGAGKSSLAFETIYQLCKDEFDALESGYFDLKRYKVFESINLVPAVGIKQHNNNNNPRSTLYSYLNIGTIISSLPKNFSNFPKFSFLKLNSPNNSCLVCDGLAENIQANYINTINENLNILDNPFLCWKSTSQNNYYYQLLLEFCNVKKIPLDIPYKQLSDSQKEVLLYGDKSLKLVFRARYSGTNKQRRAYYVGVINYIEQNTHLKSLDGFIEKSICRACNGSRINIERYKDIKIFGISFQKFLVCSFTELLNIFEKINYKGHLYLIVTSIVSIGLGYLCFSRSIPSLSGGEIQKLRFSRLMNSNISGVLIVIDEISAQINSIDYPLLLLKLKELSKNNTIILVEHSQFFINNADEKIHIGKYPGSRGGFICEDEIIGINKHLPSKSSQVKYPQEFLRFDHLNKNNVINQSVKIPKKNITVFTGISGSGKTSIAKIIEERTNAIYISQKNANYSSRSILASSLKLSERIAQYFSKHTGIPEDEFLLYKNAGCTECKGTGIVKYERGFESDLYLTCQICDGDLFNYSDLLLNSRVNNRNIIEVYKEEIINLMDYFYDDNINKVLNTIMELGLSHLNLGRKTQTLSGGEVRRIKLCENFSRQKQTTKILIIDEPTSGLDAETADKVMHLIQCNKELFQAIIIIEHREEILRYCDFEIKIGPFSGIHGGNVLSQDWL